MVLLVKEVAVALSVVSKRLDFKVARGLYFLRIFRNIFFLKKSEFIKHSFV